MTDSCEPNASHSSSGTGPMMVSSFVSGDRLAPSSTQRSSSGQSISENINRLSISASFDSAPTHFMNPCPASSSTQPPTVVQPRPSISSTITGRNEEAMPRRRSAPRTKTSASQRCWLDSYAGAAGSTKDICSRPSISGPRETSKYFSAWNGLIRFKCASSSASLRTGSSGRVSSCRTRRNS